MTKAIALGLAFLMMTYGSPLGAWAAPLRRADAARAEFERLNALPGSAGLLAQSAGGMTSSGARAMEADERADLVSATAASPRLLAQSAGDSTTTCHDECLGCPGSFCECRTICNTSSNSSYSSSGSGGPVTATRLLVLGTLLLAVLVFVNYMASRPPSYARK